MDYDFALMTPAERDQLDKVLGSEQAAILERTGRHAGWSSCRFADAYRFTTLDESLMVTLSEHRAVWFRDA